MNNEGSTRHMLGRNEIASLSHSGSRDAWQRIEWRCRLVQTKSPAVKSSRQNWLCAKRHMNCTDHGDASAVAYCRTCGNALCANCMVIHEVSRPCSVCGRRSAELVFQQSFQALERRGPVDGYDVVVCAVCGMAFADGIPPQSEFDRYYWELSKYEYEHRGGKESEDDRHRLKILADLLQSIVPDRSSCILEIGCANGRLLSYLKEAGYGDVTGVDPSPGCARAARLLYDVPVETGTVFDFRKPDTGYNFVVTLGVLEHIRDLQRAVQRIRDVTLGNGRIFVGVPDASNLIAQQDAPFQEFSTEHINFFSLRGGDGCFQILSRIAWKSLSITRQRF